MAAPALPHRRADRGAVAAYLDEIAPKATPGSREAAQAKRAETGDRMHGGARDREAGQDGLDVGEGVVMGGGGRDDFAKAVASRAARDHMMQNRKAERGAVLQVLLP